MKPSHLYGATAILGAGVNVVYGQTPVGSLPKVGTTLGMAFGCQKVVDGTLVDQTVVDAGQPTLSVKRNHKGAYVFTLVDLDIPYAALDADTDFSTLAPGLGVNRTTRLHWWEYNVIRDHATGNLVNTSAAVADYEGPQPPKGDIPHDYVLYLFSQPKGWLPPAGAQEYYSNLAGTERFNFSVSALVEQLGEPIAANYFRAQNENNTSTA